MNTSTFFSEHVALAASMLHFVNNRVFISLVNNNFFNITLKIQERELTNFQYEILPIYRSYSGDCSQWDYVARPIQLESLQPSYFVIQEASLNRGNCSN